jgi:hypothetical protein
MKNLGQDVMTQISAIKGLEDIDLRASMLRKLNTSLPKSLQLSLSSMFTNASIRRALESIEDRLASSV